MKRELIGQDPKTGKFTKEALQRQMKELLSGKKKIVVVKRRKGE